MKKNMRWVRRVLSLALVLQLCLAGAVAAGAAEPRTAGLKETGKAAKAVEAAAAEGTETQTASNPAVGLWKLSGMTGSEGEISKEDLKAYEVAEMVGYESYPYFSTLFRKATGESPESYSKRMRGLGV